MIYKIVFPYKKSIINNSFGSINSSSTSFAQKEQAHSVVYMQNICFFSGYTPSEFLSQNVYKKAGHFFLNGRHYPGEKEEQER